MTGWGRVGVEGVGRGRLWMRMERNSNWEGEQSIQHRRKRDSEGSGSRDEKMLMVKLTV
jgi:hypothetical protein